MASLEKLGKIIETDVLIIGGGLSGLWAANRAKEFVKDVTIVDKGPGPGLAGQGFFSGGGMQALPPGEDLNEFVKNIVYLGDGLYEQDLLEKIFEQSWDRVEDFQRMGVKFITDQSGKLKYIPQRGLKKNACFLGSPYGSGGEIMMEVLAREMERKGVRYMSRIYITDLLKRNGAVVGAVGFDCRGDGGYFVFKAKAVIMTAGICALRGGYEDTHFSWGDGMRMAYEAGAELKNLEFNTIWVIPKRFRWEGVTYLLPLGAEFVNESGEHFMDKYSPVLRSNCDYNYLTRGMAMEAREGRGPFYLDCSRMTPENKELMVPEAGWTKLQYDKLLADGIRPFEERQEWTAAFMYVSGVHSALDMSTTVPGLFVGGILRNMDPGIYFGGWSICKTATFGRWAAESACKYVDGRDFAEPDESEVKAMKEATYASLGKVGINPEEVLLEIQEAVFPAVILKNKKGLQAALDRIEQIRDEIEPRMAAKDPHYLAKLLGIKSMVLVSEMCLRASLMRTESRASHYREDYPMRDDKNWLKWIILNQKNGKFNFRYEALPLQKYTHKDWQYYSDNFNFPKS